MMQSLKRHQESSNLGGEVLQDGGAVDGGGGADATVGGGSVLEVTVDTTHGELKAGPGGPRHGLGLGLSGILACFASSHCDSLLVGWVMKVIWKEKPKFKIFPRFPNVLFTRAFFDKSIWVQKFGKFNKNFGQKLILVRPLAFRWPFWVDLGSFIG